MRLSLLPLAILLMPVAALAETVLISVIDHKIQFERTGTMTSLKCEASDRSDECGLLADMDLSPSVDWERLERKDANLKGGGASETVVDQHGGPWVFSIKKGAGSVKPDFPGYRLELERGKIGLVEVLRKPEHWKAACDELGLDEQGHRKKKKKLFGD